MSNHTPKAGPLPNGSINFDKVHENARAGKDDIYEGAVRKQRKEVSEGGHEPASSRAAREAEEAKAAAEAAKSDKPAVAGKPA